MDDVGRLPHARFEAGRESGRECAGGIRQVPDGGWREPDLLVDRGLRGGSPPRVCAPDRPFLDHAGVDLRRESPEVRAAFDKVPEQARGGGWRHVPQGGEAGGVFCCHTEVRGKHWVYPAADAKFLRPIEFAYGALLIHGKSMGCDLRPIDPAHRFAAQVKAMAPCCGVTAVPVTLAVNKA